MPAGRKWRRPAKQKRSGNVSHVRAEAESGALSVPSSHRATRCTGKKVRVLCQEDRVAKGAGKLLYRVGEERARGRACQAPKASKEANDGIAARLIAIVAHYRPEQCGASTRQK